MKYITGYDLEMNNQLRKHHQSAVASTTDPMHPTLANRPAHHVGTIQIPRFDVRRRIESQLFDSYCLLGALASSNCRTR